MKLFSSFLPKLLKDKNLYSEAKASYILEKMSQIFENNLGPEAKIHLVPVKFSQEKIFIQASSSSWRNELLRNKKIFLELLRKDFPEEKFSDISIR